MENHRFTTFGLSQWEKMQEKLNSTGKKDQPGTHFNGKYQQGMNFIFQQEITSLGELNWRYDTFCFAYYFTVLVGFLYFFSVCFLLKGEGSCKLMKKIKIKILQMTLGEVYETQTNS